MPERDLLPSWNDNVVVDHIMAGPALNDLLDLASEVCLTVPEQVDYYIKQLEGSRPDSAEQRLLRKLGLRGLQTAVNYARHGSDAYLNLEDEGQDSDFVYATQAIYEPRFFSGELVASTQTKIEAFGKAILDEAFLCLGDEAPEVARKWAASESEEEERECADWLLKRITDIATTNDPPPTEDTGSAVPEEEDNQITDVFYHPSLLSPKIIGTYPNIEAKPSCLGLSILIAAFCEKLGLPYLHCGVAKSYTDAARNDYTLLIDEAKTIAGDLGVEIPDQVLQKLAKIDDRNTEINLTNMGYHAAVSIKLKHGEKWLQLDPYFSSNVFLTGNAYENLNRIYDQLETFNQYLPGSEIISNDFFNMPVSYLSSMLRDFLPKSPSLSEIDTFLATSVPLSVEELAAQFIEPFFFGATDDQGLISAQEYLRHYIKEIDVKVDGEDFRQLLEYCMKHAIQTYVFPDAKQKGLEYCFDRCKTDAAYRARRAEDIKLAPVYFMVKLAGDLTNLIVAETVVHEHRRLELGLPGYRIGACVLNDFAVYCGDNLPASFWLTYWPSLVAVTEHIPPDVIPENEPMLNNNIGSIQRSLLIYDRSYGIIKQFLEQTSKEGDK